jgi:hypothetical protein
LVGGGLKKGVVKKKGVSGRNFAQTFFQLRVECGKILMVFGYLGTL